MNDTNEAAPLDAPFASWAILEIMGHRVRPGFVQEVAIAGGKMLRVDVPRPGDRTVTEYYGTASIFSLTPCTEEVARKSAGVWSPPAPPIEHIRDAPSDYDPFLDSDRDDHAGDDL